MTVPVPYTWSDDEVVTASLLNANLRDPQNWLLGLPMFMGHNTAATVLLASTNLSVPINVEDVNIGGFTHATNDSKVYLPEDGWYRYIVLGGFKSTTYGNTDNRGVWVYKNGVYVPGGVYTSHLDTASREAILGGRTALFYGVAGDYIEIRMYQSTPSSTDTYTAVANTEWQSTLSLIWQGRDAT